MANRVKRVLPSIISNCQNGFVGNRSIYDSIRLVQDIIQYTEITQSAGVLLSVDFREKFGSIEGKFIIKALRKHNFGPGLINWINIVYSNISSCIYNNGKTSRYISLHRGVSYGDNLSPYLLIIAADILSHTITKDHHIKGFKINSTEIKITQYADDLTLLLSDTNSVTKVLSTLKIFGECSDLKINQEKTVGMLLGAWKNRQNLPQNIKWTSKPVNMFGVYISNSPNKTIMLNF